MRLPMLVLAAAMCLHAADVSGRWVGTSEFVDRGGEVRTGPVLMQFTQKGEELQGKAGPTAARQEEIRKGKLVGNRVTFEADDSGDPVFVEMVLQGDALSGSAKFRREYGVIEYKLNLKRE